MNNEYEYEEKRLSARIKGAFHIKILNNDEEIKVSTIDISSSGLRFLSKTNIPLFRELSLSLSLPFDHNKNEKFTCHAIVVRSEKSTHAVGYNIALTFVEISNKDKKTLDKFLEEASN